MYSIIPLAGPDFLHPKLGIKPLFKIDGQPLISKIIYSRSWIKNGEVESKNMIFVLRDIEEAKKFESFLKKNFPNCKIVKIPTFTLGALMSCLAATSLIKNFNAPISVDLIDIDFYLPKEISVNEIFQKNSDIDAILPYFKSDNQSYSYADISSDGLVLSTKEKKGWSFGNKNSTHGNASAGVYFFRNLNVLLRAVIDGIDNFDDYSHNDLLFLCPAMNSVVKNNKKVLGIEVFNVNSVGLQFK